MSAKKIRSLFEKRMEKFKSIEDAHFLCEIASTYALFEILDELQDLNKRMSRK
jgi:hypothetical protein